MPKGKLLRNMWQPFTSQLRAHVWVSLHHSNNDLCFWGTDQAAMQACSSVQAGNTPDLPFAAFSGDLGLSCLTLGLTTGSSSLPSDSTTRTEASLCLFATILLLPGRSSSSSLSDSEKIPGEKNQWEDGAIHVLQDHFMCA